MSITTTSPAEEYTVARIGKQWYPIKVDRIFTALYPEGQVYLRPLQREDDADAFYARRSDALAYCQQQADEQDAYEHGRWLHLADCADLEPERNEHYKDIIEEITGLPPVIEKYYRLIIVKASPYRCFRCGKVHGAWQAFGRSEQDVLSRVAEQVYRVYTICLARPVDQPVHQMQAFV